MGDAPSLDTLEQTRQEIQHALDYQSAARRSSPTASPSQLSRTRSHTRLPVASNVQGSPVRHVRAMPASVEQATPSEFYEMSLAECEAQLEGFRQLRQRQMAMMQRSAQMDQGEHGHH
eukprot:TRINITY_DN1698_c0_g1_i2.p1 TRINITY_DN1698_c0_g1~~TRINITY_DN1698_c0_g1_i2.p1  ORF type:complete len:128 (+),score=27.85 TRINITY_DN1698_c0_g1_i2:33-386(+)